KLPTLTIIKQLTGQSATFFYTVTGANTINTNLTPAANSSAQFGPVVINPGQDVVNEVTPLPPGYILTDSFCMGATTQVGSNPGPNGQADFTWTLTADYGQNVVCTFTNSGIGTTRTQGFWATHVDLSNSVWGGNGLTLPPNAPAGASQVINPVNT